MKGQKMIDTRVKIYGELEDALRASMAESGVTAPICIAGILCKHFGIAEVHQPKQNASFEVDMSVFDDIPDHHGRRGYAATAIRYLISEIEVGQSVLVKCIRDKMGKSVSPDRASMLINKNSENGTFSVITRGVPNGQYIIRRNT